MVGRGTSLHCHHLQHSVLPGLFATDITEDHFLPLCPCKTHGQGGSRAQHSLCSPGAANLLKETRMPSAATQPHKAVPG